MTTYIDRSKFKTEYGRKLYDLLKPMSPHEDWLYLMLMLAKTDARRKQVIEFILNSEKTFQEINEFIINKWG